MSSLLIKLIVFPAALSAVDFAVADMSLGGINALWAGIALALAAHVIDLLLLRRIGAFWTALADAPLFIALLSFVPAMLGQSSLSISGAIWTSVVLTLTEYALHLHALVHGKIRR